MIPIIPAITKATVKLVINSLLIPEDGLVEDGVVEDGVVEDGVVEDGVVESSIQT